MSPCQALLGSFYHRSHERSTQAFPWSCFRLQLPCGLRTSPLGGSHASILAALVRIRADRTDRPTAEMPDTCSSNCDGLGTCAGAWGGRGRHFPPEQGQERLQARAASSLGHKQLACAVCLEYPQQQAGLQRHYIRQRLKLHELLRRHDSLGRIQRKTVETQRGGTDGCSAHRHMLTVCGNTYICSGPCQPAPRHFTRRQPQQSWGYNGKFLPAIVHLHGALAHGPMTTLQSCLLHDRRALLPPCRGLTCYPAHPDLCSA